MAWIRRWAVVERGEVIFLARCCDCQAYFRAKEHEDREVKIKAHRCKK